MYGVCKGKQLATTGEVVEADVYVGQENGVQSSCANRQQRTTGSTAAENSDVTIGSAAAAAGQLRPNSGR